VDREAEASESVGDLHLEPYEYCQRPGPIPGLFLFGLPIISIFRTVFLRQDNAKCADLSTDVRSPVSLAYFRLKGDATGIGVLLPWGLLIRPSVSAPSPRMDRVSTPSLDELATR
jgi:hypothetical protein